MCRNADEAMLRAPSSIRMEHLIALQFSIPWLMCRVQAYCSRGGTSTTLEVQRGAFRAASPQAGPTGPTVSMFRPGLRMQNHLVSLIWEADHSLCVCCSAFKCAKVRTTMRNCLR
jgi:hypothetical protein